MSPTTPAIPAVTRSGTRGRRPAAGRSKSRPAPPPTSTPCSRSTPGRPSAPWPKSRATTKRQGRNGFPVAEPTARSASTRSPAPSTRSPSMAPMAASAGSSSNFGADPRTTISPTPRRSRAPLRRFSRRATTRLRPSSQMSPTTPAIPAVTRFGTRGRRPRAARFGSRPAAPQAVSTPCSPSTPARASTASPSSLQATTPRTRAVANPTPRSTWTSALGPPTGSRSTARTGVWGAST